MKGCWKMGEKNGEVSFAKNHILDINGPHGSIFVHHSMNVKFLMDQWIRWNPMDLKNHRLGSGEEFCKSRFYVDLRGNLRRWSFHKFPLLMVQKSGEKTTWDGAKTPVNNGRCSTTFPSTAATLNRSSNLPIQRCIMNYHENPRFSQ